MTSPTHAVSAPTPPAAVAPSSANALTAGAVASSNPNSTGVTSSTKINSIKELREKAPEVYQKMLEGIAMNICGKMKDHQDRLKQMMRDSNRS